MTRPHTPQGCGTVRVETLGCKLNLADSEIIARSFEKAGFPLAPEDSNPSLYILNTCTVTHVADRKARHLLRMARRRNPNALIVATGCYAQRDKEALERLRVADLVVGNESKARLVEMVKEALQAKGSTASLPMVSNAAQVRSPARNGGKPIGDRAFVKIQEGCNDVCSYCIIPKVRGPSHHFSIDQIINDVQEKQAEGYQEVVLTGTQLGDYGQEKPGRKAGASERGNNLPALLRRLLEETNIPRIRISSLQPQDIDEELLDLWQDPRMCRHFHMPLQSGSDPVLSSMRRRYSAVEYTAKVDEIRRQIASVSVTTDVIIGYPRETEEDFETTYRLCEDLSFSAMHLFPYSAREGTGAARMPGVVEESVKRERMEKLLSLSSQCSVRFLRRMVGMTLPVLWEEHKELDADGTRVRAYSGLTDNYIRVYLNSEDNMVGRITPTKLLRPAGNSAVWGEPIT